MKTLKERIEVEQAALEGKLINSKSNNGDCATYNIMVGGDFIFDWANHDYEVKPWPLEFWVNVFENDSTALAYKSEERAKEQKISSVLKTIKVREVLE